MINHLIGIITEKTLPSVTVDVKGVGYQVDVPMSTYSELPEKPDVLASDNRHFLTGALVFDHYTC